MVSFLSNLVSQAGQVLQDAAGGVPNTRTRTSYGTTIHCRIGNVRATIGGIQNVDVRQGRQVDEEWCMNALATGLPQHLVAQTLKTRQIAITRYDLQSAWLEQVFGQPEMITLLDQRGWLSIRMQFKSPVDTASPSIIGQKAANILNTAGGILGGVFPTIRVFEFYGCYFVDTGRSIRVDDVRVGVNATLVWTGIQQLQ